MGNLVTESAKLLVKLHGQSSRTIELTGDTFTIGRKADNDLPIDDHTVSARHARLVRIQSVYFIEDLNSTNGTTVNGTPIERAQLHDADVITIGQHRIIFRDNAPSPAAAAPGSPGLDQTMVLTGKQRSAAPTIAGRILITAGKTDRLEYHLTKTANLIGAQDGAAIRLTGWFAPKSAALISSRGSVFVISPSEGGKRLLVNGTPVATQQQLKNGDAIEVAGVSMTFYVSQQKLK